MIYLYGTWVNNRLSNIVMDSHNYSYSYDNKGNLITDNRKGVNFNLYNYRNQPLQMTQGGNSYRYNYDDLGNRYFKTSSTNKYFYLYDHFGREMAVYTFNIPVMELKFVNIQGVGLIGRIEPSDTYYYLKDHLGNIRQTVNSTGTIYAAQDYYAYGSPLRSYNAGLAYEWHKFTEKERDSETGYDYFGARYYDSEIGRWLQVDPFAFYYPGWSTYNYSLNNPMTNIDPNGNWVNIWFAFRALQPIYTLPVITVIGNRYENSSVESNVGVQGLELGGGISIAISTPALLIGSLIFLQGDTDPHTMMNEESNNSENSNEKPKNLTDKIGKIAEKFGKTEKQVRDAIHKVKNAGLKAGGSVKNPDVEVDLDNGEVYPKAPDGDIGDSIGNILDYL